MSDWFRVWHGAVTDPKWRTVARRAGSDVRPGDVWCVVTALMEHASRLNERGSIVGFPISTVAEQLGFEVDLVERILQQLRAKAIIVEERFADWRDIRSPGSDRPSPTVWRALREFVFGRDGYICQYCGERGRRLECDHVVPVSRGGSSEPENLLTACFDCNRSKRDKLLSEWVR